MVPSFHTTEETERGVRSRRRHSSPDAGQRPAWLAFVADHSQLAVILAMIVLIPLLTGSARLESAGKMVAFEALGAALVALAIGRWAFQKQERDKSAIMAGARLPLMLLLGLGAISCALTPFHAFALAELLRWGLCALVYVVLATHLGRRGLLQTMTDGLLLVTAAVSLIGLAEMADGMNAAIAGPFGSHELLGSFLLLMLPLALALGLADSGDERRQLAAQGVALLAAACLLMARTRSAWLGAAVSLAVLALLAWKQMPADARDLAGLRRRKHLIVGPLLILIGGLVLLVGITQTGGVLDTRAATLAHVDMDDSFQARLAMWHGALKMAEARPLFGWGIGSFPVRESLFTGTGNSPSYVLVHGTSHSNIAHNFYLQTAAEVGFVGLGLYLAVLAAFFVGGLNALGKMQKKPAAAMPRLVLIGCLAAMAGQMVDAFGSPAYNFASVSLFQWVLLGIGTAAARLGVQAKTAEMMAEAAPAKPMPRALRTALAAVASLGVLALIGPSMNAAFAQNCTMGTSTFTVIASNGRDSRQVSLSSGQAETLNFTLNGRPARTATYTVTGVNFFTGASDPTALSYVTISGANPGPTVTVTRNSTPDPTSGNDAVNVFVSYQDPTTGKTFTNNFVIGIL